MPSPASVAAAALLFICFITVCLPLLCTVLVHWFGQLYECLCLKKRFSGVALIEKSDSSV